MNDYVKRFDLTTIADLKKKIKACKELEMTFTLHGQFREFTYDVIDGVMVGEFTKYANADIDGLRRYSKFNENNIKFVHIHANDHEFTPKDQIVDFDAIEFTDKDNDKRIMVLDKVEMRIWANPQDPKYWA